MNYVIGLFTIFLFSINSLNCQTTISDSKKLQIETYVNETIERFGIPGAAYAIIKDNQVVYKNYLGTANLENDVPITKESLFRLHSLSKIFVAVGIFQLVEKNEIALDDPISMYLEGLPKEWQNITIAHLLSHSSGLPDMREETNPSEEAAIDVVYNKKIQFEKGLMVSYNQTNFWLLNRIIRKISSTSFQQFISNQFKESSKACFSNLSDIIPNRVTEYNPNDNGKLQHYQFYVADYMYGAGGLTLSLDDFIEWDNNLNENHLISTESMEEMFKKYEYKTESSYAFTHGWFIQNLNNIQSYGFNGGGLANYRTFPSKGLSIIWLTNGYTIPYDLDNVTNTILGFVDEDLKDKTTEAQKIIYTAFTERSEEEAIMQYEIIKTKYPFVNFENALNSIGYAFLEEKSISKAISIFKLNTTEFPTSANAYDSLGEAYFLDNKFDLSRKNFQQSLKLNPANQNAKKYLSELEKQIEK